MILSRYNLKKINVAGLSIPGEEIFDLPEKVLQFGTGALLRGLPCYLIDKANREGQFNGRVVVVKSTDKGSTIDFDRQDGLFTLHIKGIEEGTPVDEQIICAAISRVLSAGKDWDKILHTAHNPDLEIIISNTTETGIRLVQDDINSHPPISFPGKLLAILYERYKAFGGSHESGFIIIPTELIPDNGKKLEAIVLELAHLNHLEPAFMDWLENSNNFCSSLVDRIVPGTPCDTLLTELENQSGYIDKLRTITEAYCLWAIEGDDRVRAVLSFAAANPGVVIKPDIEIYRELKLRLLNGTHSLGCAIALLGGFKTVKEAMADTHFFNFINYLMRNEIAPAIPYPIDPEVAANFTVQVLDRFKNPGIEHRWIGISAQYSSKLKLRVLPLLVNYYNVHQAVPEGFAFGFAGFILFMKVCMDEDGNFMGLINGCEYPVTDNQAVKFSAAWANVSVDDVVETILADDYLWDTDLRQLPGFKNEVVKYVRAMQFTGVPQVLKNFNRKIVERGEMI